jgi:predicted aspartyl protease
MSDHGRRAFTCAYPGLARAIYTPVRLFFGEYGAAPVYAINALWDTGAMISVVTPRVVERLGLQKIDMIAVTGANSTNNVDVVLVSCMLPNKVLINNLRAAVCTIDPATEMLIGMDLITLMDFAITHGGGQTQFSFAIPPFKEKIDFENR